MFEYQRKLNLVAKVLTIAGIGMSVGFGTCGLAFLTASGRVGPFRSFIGGAGAVLFFFSLAGAVITALVAIGNLIVKSFRK